MKLRGDVKDKKKKTSKEIKKMQLCGRRECSFFLFFFFFSFFHDEWKEGSPAIW